MAEKGREEVISVTVNIHFKGGYKIKDKLARGGINVPKIKNKNPPMVRKGIKGKTKILERGATRESFPKLKIRSGKQNIWAAKVWEIDFFTKEFSALITFSSSGVKYTRPKKAKRKVGSRYLELKLRDFEQSLRRRSKQSTERF